MMSILEILGDCETQNTLRDCWLAPRAFRGSSVHTTDGSCSVLRSSRRVASGAPGDRGSCEEADEGISRGDPE